MEDDLKGITPVLKNSIMEVDLNESLVGTSLASQFCTGLGPAQSQLVYIFL